MWRYKCKCFAKGDTNYIFCFPFLRNDFLDYVVQTGKNSRSVALTELLAIWEWDRFISIFIHYRCESTPFLFMPFFFTCLLILVLFWCMGVHACVHAVCVCVWGGQVIYQNFGQGNIAPKIINFVGVYRPAFDNYIVSCSIIFPMR